MHYIVLVLLDAEDATRVDEAVAEAMEPHSEHTPGDGHWDWFQIGGRWTGALSTDYDPEKDPANREKCEFCKGTGKRDDADNARADLMG